MTIKTIGIQSPGDMGHAIGRVLGAAGYQIVSALENRSPRTINLAESSGIKNVGSVTNLLHSADVILSIMRPDKALSFIDELISSKESARSHLPTLVDLNAISPTTGRVAAEKATAAGFDFIDGGIIGGPPRPPTNKSPRLYISGPQAKKILTLNDTGLDFRILGNQVGSASAIKMCYAALTKGLTAIGIQSMVTAHIEGVADSLLKELGFSQPNLLKHLEKGLPDMCPKAYRWIGEMEEISKTHLDCNLPSEMFIGAAEIYRLVEKSPLGVEIVEDRKIGKTVEEVAHELVTHISQNNHR